MVRDKIKAGQLLERLQNYALAELGEENPGMSKGQVSAALGLLKKCVPDLTNTELSVDPESKSVGLIGVAFVAPLK